MKKYFVLFSVIVTSFTFCSVKKKSNDIVWKNVIGTIEPMGRETYIHYYVDGNLHTERYYLIIYGAVKGEKFTMRYNVKDPKEIQIDYWNPVFEKEEDIKYSKAQVKWVHWFSFHEPKYVLHYTYDIGLGSITKEQVLRPKYKNYYPNLKKGQVYEVEFSPENPQRGVLNLDKAIVE